MSLMIAVSTLFALLMVDEVEATSNDELLAKKFSHEQVEVSTVLEDVSFGQLKERVTRPASNEK